MHHAPGYVVRVGSRLCPHSFTSCRWPQLRTHSHDPTELFLAGSPLISVFFGGAAGVRTWTRFGGTAGSDVLPSLPRSLRPTLSTRHRMSRDMRFELLMIGEGLACAAGPRSGWSWALGTKSHFPASNMSSTYPHFLHSQSSSHHPAIWPFTPW